MQLVNQTPVLARLGVTELPGKPFRAGILVAKATFRVTDRGAELETQTPYPVLLADEETELGVLPQDDLARRDDLFEVILLGAAYVPGGAPVGATTVSLAIGDLRREIAVHGDRVWEDRAGSPAITEPVPFTRMPLTWPRAFGGTAEVLVDDASPIDLADPRNPAGRGFDPGPAARDLCRAWKAPAGYPAYDVTRRLPNLEDPRAPIRAWNDAPAPLCWATLPMGSPLHHPAAGMDPAAAQAMRPEQLMVLPQAFYRAHPDWMIARPRPGATVRAEGVRADGAAFAFAFPALRVFADYVTGRHRGAREIEPRLLVLLPEAGRFYVVYRHAFTVRPLPGEEQGMRLRLEGVAP
jgi:hypothetical protein